MNILNTPGNIARQFVSMRPFTVSNPGKAMKNKMAVPRTCRDSMTNTTRKCLRLGLTYPWLMTDLTDLIRVRISGAEKAKKRAQSQATWSDNIVSIHHVYTNKFVLDIRYL